MKGPPPLLPTFLHLLQKGKVKNNCSSPPISLALSIKRPGLSLWQVPPPYISHPYMSSLPLFWFVSARLVIVAGPASPLLSPFSSSLLRPGLSLWQVPPHEPSSSLKLPLPRYPWPGLSLWQVPPSYTPSREHFSHPSLLPASHVISRHGARLVIVACPAQSSSTSSPASLFSHISLHLKVFFVFGPACHCGRSRLATSHSFF